MNFFELIESRRSIRRFKSEPVEDAVLARILEAGRLAPSRANSQPWEFRVIRDADVKKRLHAAAYHQAPILEAPVVIAVLGIVDPRGSVPQRTLELVEAGAFGEDVKDFADHVLDNWNEQDLRADAALNSAIAATLMMLAAHELGLGCCWVKLCQDGEVLTVLEATQGFYLAALLAIGVPDEAPAARPRLPLSDLVRDDASSPMEGVE